MTWSPARHEEACMFTLCLHSGVDHGMQRAVAELSLVCVMGWVSGCDSWAYLLCVVPSIWSQSLSTSVCLCFCWVESRNAFLLEIVWTLDDIGWAGEMDVHDTPRLGALTLRDNISFFLSVNLYLKKMLIQCFTIHISIFSADPIISFTTFFPPA